MNKSKIRIYKTWELVEIASKTGFRGEERARKFIAINTSQKESVYISMFELLYTSQYYAKNEPSNRELSNFDSFVNWIEIPENMHHISFKGAINTLFYIKIPSVYCFLNGVIKEFKISDCKDRAGFLRSTSVEEVVDGTWFRPRNIDVDICN